MKSKKAKEIEKALGIELKNETRDLEAIENQWGAFYEAPARYAGTFVIDCVNLWYSEECLKAEPQSIWVVTIENRNGNEKVYTRCGTEDEACSICEDRGWNISDPATGSDWRMDYHEEEEIL